MLTNIVDCDFDALRIGQRVRLVFQPHRGRPAGADVHAGIKKAPPSGALSSSSAV